MAFVVELIDVQLHDTQQMRVPGQTVIEQMTSIVVAVEGGHGNNGSSR